MRHDKIKEDDVILNLSSVIHIAGYNGLRRKLYVELEGLPGAKEVFDKYNVFFVDGYDEFNRINIDAPKESK